MNLKTLYVLYFVLVISVVFTIGASVFNKESFESFADGYNSGRDIGNDPEKGERPGYTKWYGMIFPIDVEKSVDSEITCGTLAPDTPQVLLSLRQMKASVINTEALPASFHYFNGAMVIGSLIVTVLMIYLLVLLVKLFLRMRKSIKAGMAFSMGVVKVLRSLGIVLIAVSFLSTLCYFFHNKAVQIVIAPYDYKVDSYLDMDYTLIIFGVSLLVMSEFLKIGYKMQEEQSLTV